MKLVRQMPLPKTLKRKRNRYSRYRELVLIMAVGDGYECCTMGEKHGIYKELVRAGFDSATMKCNGSGYKVWKLKRKS